MSKFMYFDFRCATCGAKFTGFVKPDVQETPCKECSKPANRLISAPRLDPKMGLDPDFPTAYDAWEKTRKNKRAIEKKHLANTGDDKTFGGDVSN